MSTVPPIEGFCDPRFAAVEAAFRENFAAREELGAAVAVYIDGKPVVDLWGGPTLKNGEPGQPWQRDTIVRMMSVNKGITAICAHMLADRGLLDYEKPVAAYWPEFAQAGKGAITVRMLLSGLAALVFADEVPAGMAFEWDAMAEGLARQAPNWEPGTQGAYHSSTYGNLVGEVIRRITGKLPGVFFRDEIGEPLGIDYWFALPPSEWGRVSDVMNNRESTTLTEVSAGATTPLGRAWRIYGEYALMRDAPYCMEREMPSSNGRGNARAVGKLFAALACGGTLDGVRLMSPDTIRRMSEVAWDGPCGLTRRPMRYAMGVFRNVIPPGSMGTSDRAFGHRGLGGAVGFADPDNRIAFGYSPNYMCAGDEGDRAPALVHALYGAL